MLAFRSFGVVVALLTATSCGSPPLSSPNDWNLTETQSPVQTRSLGNGVGMRILPLGDSITWGHGSTDGNGYRWTLLQMLTDNKATYIGSQRSGSMVNNNNEGHPGAQIDEISDYAHNSLGLDLQPNIVLLMAGTNDINRRNLTERAPARLASLIDKMLLTCPDAVIIVAQITPIGDTAIDQLAQTFNAAIPGIVAARANSGSKILTVDMHRAVVTDNLPDGLHPNSSGYSDMAKEWYTGIEKAASNGWIGEPISLPAGGNKAPCGTYLYWDAKFGQIATGVGSGDSAFVAGWRASGQLAAGGVGTDNILYRQGAGVRLADMDGDGRDDYLWVDPFTGAVTLYLNGGYSPGGGVNWVRKGQIATGVGDGAGVVFADINGDGRDDYLWVAENGDVTAYINGGEQAGGWSWTNLGKIAGGTGATRATTRFADIDGDGRADYFVVGSGGSLNGWLNYGYNDKPDWQAMGIIATGIGDAAGVFLYDLNNDGRADYIHLEENGAANVYINTRGPWKGLGPTWVNVGQIATGVGAARGEIVFGDIDGDGKKDYVRVHPDTGALDVWMNTASGGTYVVGDSTRFADMDGDGLDDYLSISPNGAILMYRNRGWDQSSNQWGWESQGTIATGAGARMNIRIADLDGDGLADYLVVDEQSGAVVFWKNGGKEAGGTWKWTYEGQVATGVGAGIGVRFADIDGDGKADYLWVDKNGAVKAWLNGGNGSNGWVWHAQGVIATGVGAARQDVQFHDIDGDGLADYLYVNRLDGSVLEWKNGGARADADWSWQSQGQIATGVGANGMCIQFADLNGQGRADYLNVAPASGAVVEWYNACFGDGASIGTGTPAWKTAQCTDSGVIDASMDPQVRWRKESTSSAWVAAVANWRANPSPGGLGFTQQVSNFFHGPEFMNCGATADHNGCDTTVTCSAVNYPAGFFILNSFTQINRMNMNFYDAISRSESQMTVDMSTFSSTFAPIQDQTRVEKLILDVVGLGFALVAAPMWNVVLKKLDWSTTHSNELSWIKDSINPIVSNGITIIKDAKNLGDLKLNARDKLESAMGSLVKYWATAITFVNSNMFDGSTTSLALLSQMISDGRALGPQAIISDIETQGFLEKAIYALLIPNAWKLSNKSFRPFILNSGVACTDKNPLSKYIDDKTAKATYVCYQDIAYYFVSVSGDYRNCDNSDPCGLPSCFNNLFTALPGMDALEKQTYGGVSKGDLVQGALAGYKANGNRNGWPMADATKATTVSNLYDSGIHSPGVVMIPICSAKVAFDNWVLENSNDPAFPCQAASPSKRRDLETKLEAREEQERREREEVESRLDKRVCAR